ncbi:MAG: DUF1801 domain-containing protein [Candidatus Kariarchaeaceae archaeon]
MTEISYNAYLRSLSPDRRKIIERIAELAQELYPEIQQNMKYKLPSFTLENVSLFQIASQKDYLGLYISKKLLSINQTILEGWDVGKGTIKIKSFEEFDENIIRAVLSGVKEFPFEYSKRGDSSR